MPPIDNNMLWATALLAVTGAVVFFARLAITTTKTLVKLDALLPVMFAMAAQFKSDSGSTLKDQINSLEAAAFQNKQVASDAQLAARELKTSVEIIRTEQVRLTAAAERVAQFTANITQRQEEIGRDRVGGSVNVGGDSEMKGIPHG